MHKFKIGLIINPLAGLGGSVALKGSDNVAEQALSLGAIPMANKRSQMALNELLPHQDRIEILTVNGQMGEDACGELGLDCRVVYHTCDSSTNAEDSCKAAKILVESDVDIILFAGGDGTARDICSVVETSALVLGIPAGCKIHSGVYAVTPKAAGRVMAMLASGEMLSVADADVMDIDEGAFRQGTVRAKLYGEMQVPSELRYIQNVKMGGKESDEMVLQDIAEYVIGEMEAEQTYIMGSGSTVAFMMEELGLENTLLGVDIIQDQQLLHSDVSAEQLFTLAQQAGKGAVKLVITVIGGQGHILGRGNQQLSAKLIGFIGKENIIVVATKTKLKALQGRPLLVDTGDEALDEALAGLIKVTTGYKDHVMYAVS
ncbi:MAG: putative polyphosphate/ATP-dependent NAD kinase [Phenylobacterium sp.]|jgi:predicted polyphosphate/ATP-dependent NAD kinase